MSTPLQNKRILVTRPEKQAKNLCSLITDAGGIPIAYPTMVIESITPTELPNVAQFDHVVFISANAVNHAASCIDLSLIKSHACVGARTKAALLAHGIEADVYPETQFNSEGLLALPVFKAPLNKHILIVRGVGGKETLKQEFENRGASVTYFECYQRALPNIDYQPLRYAFLTNDIDIVTSSSSQSLLNLLQICPDALTVPLISISPDMTAKAQSWGYQAPICEAENATDEAIIEALIQFYPS